MDVRFSTDLCPKSILGFKSGTLTYMIFIFFQKIIYVFGYCFITCFFKVVMN